MYLFIYLLSALNHLTTSITSYIISLFIQFYLQLFNLFLYPNVSKAYIQNWTTQSNLEFNTLNHGLATSINFLPSWMSICSIVFSLNGVSQIYSNYLVISCQINTLVRCCNLCNRKLWFLLPLFCMTQSRFGAKSAKKNREKSKS